MELTREIAEKAAQKMSPEHSAHGWRPRLECEVRIGSTGGYMDHPVLEITIGGILGTKESPSSYVCDGCGEIVESVLLEGTAARGVLEEATGIEFLGSLD